MNTYIIYLLLYLVIFISVINFLNDAHNNIIKEKIKKEEDQKKIRNLEIEGFSGYVDACVLLSFFRKEDAVVLLIKWIEDN
ncbi:hypothetical protein, partial [Methyloglobulus sp.]|uniref:hypothetical protein n=1 Tax=Methyloglobulus sp. TaxID=2518622 RepID=UPI0032B7C3E1